MRELTIRTNLYFKQILMESTSRWQHAVLQRLIIVFLGLLTLGVALQSCSVSHASCAAYDEVKVEESAQ